MLKTKPVIVDYDAITAYGDGVNMCWQGLLKNHSAISDIDRFDTSHFISNKAATIKGLVYGDEKSLVIQMLERLKNTMNESIPADADLMLASLNGEIDYVEQSALTGAADASENRLDRLLIKTQDLFGVRGKAMVVSAACASSSIAIARAASLIKAGESDCILVVACDCVSEFLISGFSALMALDKQNARPFDKQRAGLNVGEASAYVLLMSQERAKKEGRTISAQMLGWGMSCDANHMTGPSMDGEGLYLAIQRALDLGEMTKENIDSICAHGTGTVYNDSMEIQAFKKLFNDGSRPTYSIKGGVGHTMGSAGIMDVVIALETIKNNVLPATIGMEEVDEQANGWITDHSIELKHDVVLSTNSGFGGINSALLIGRLDD